MPDKNKIIATLLITAEFDCMPDTNEIRSIVESVTGIGIPTKATLTIYKDTTMDLLR